eukprot:Plantae.Rhodophyta-Hildenbrandia_rubra.ctg40310.p1 GENE.Plantae.Rhodophyta-Hildenbrandia_rubra.ctg40310~~Plantae.Rhodophyta-Hildenbrandia_rubra.ctg40310.p1  ORF type:complete len:255 (+),score=38.86 Plantae.Rhodophyta-Hildenbrandia_rubra.ctg40310:107-871(+)
MRPISVRPSVDRDFLESLVDLGEFDGIGAFSELTDDLISAWLEAKVEEDFEPLTIEALESEAQRSARMNICEADPALRVTTLFTGCASFLRSKNWGHLIDASPKLAIEQACSLLKPLELRQKIEPGLELSMRKIRKQWKPFYKRVMQKAVISDEFIPIRPSKSKDKGASAASEGSKFRKNKDDDESNAKEIKPAKESKSKAEASTGSSKGDKPAPSCLNPKRKKKHCLRERADALDEEKKRLLAEYRKNKKKAA